MSSWLGGLGSGLGQSLGQVGGSLSSFTGQISTFTKDMLLEGVEEVGVREAEEAHTELEEKLEASEIQNKQQSTEVVSMRRCRPSSSPPTSPCSPSPPPPPPPPPPWSPPPPPPPSCRTPWAPIMVSTGDEMDLSDVLWSQQEINRLSTEVTRLEAELSHWRRVAQVTAAHQPLFCFTAGHFHQ
ncbi:hypothetical protein CRUP_004572 [Coryphaenoides rupestris]|nr:hypothetical protein CRUP_004572 [Coryphaenoides rupestris]